jgi:hypothetical protein
MTCSTAGLRKVTVSSARRAIHGDQVEVAAARLVITSGE